VDLVIVAYDQFWSIHVAVSFSFSPKKHHLAVTSLYCTLHLNYSYVYIIP
ncbi:unnamed protein product, partial [Arabidopsis halleri]